MQHVLQVPAIHHEHPLYTWPRTCKPTFVVHLTDCPGLNSQERSRNILLFIFQIRLYWQWAPMKTVLLVSALPNQRQCRACSRRYSWAISVVAASVIATHNSLILIQHFPLFCFFPSFSFIFHITHTITCPLIRSRTTTFTVCNRMLPVSPLLFLRAIT